MKALFLNYEFPPLGGGAATANYYLFKSWAKNKKIRITLVTASPDKHKEYFFAPNIKIINLDVGKKGKGKLFQKLTSILTYMVKSTLRSITIAKKEQFDCVVAFFAIPSGLTALLLKLIFRIPYVVSLRGSDVPGFNERFKFIYPLLKPFFRLILSQSNAVLANSLHLKNLALKTGVNKHIIIIPNGVDTNVFKPKKNRSKILTFLVVARLIKRKSVDTIIKAAAFVKNKVLGFNLIIVGDGDQKKILQLLVKQLKLTREVQFAGELDRKQVPQTYSKSHIFISASKNEGMSNAILEAMASGLAIISTPTGDINTLLKNNCMTFPIGDVKQLAKHMHHLLTNTRKRTTLGNISRKCAIGMNWNTIAYSYLKVINKVLT